MKGLLAALSLAALSSAAAAPAAPLPTDLRDTGPYAGRVPAQVRSGVLSFAPQYPLWSDGTAKRRWLYLPPGASIDAAKPYAWDFPPGTKAWKEFSYGARRVETRYLERLANGSWRFAVYVWNEEGTQALLAPERGIASLPVAEAPGGRYAVPSRNDCRACHEGPAVPVLGFSLLQLSPDRDPLAPHAERASAEHADLARLAASGRLRNLPASFLAVAPRIDAPTPTARAALGYLHGNCGHCHTDAGALAGVGLVLAQPAAAHGRPDRAAILRRMQAPNPIMRMPPLGVRVVDKEALALLERWARNESKPPQEPFR
jgi:mono/diheme cytochrome c family protein